MSPDDPSFEDALERHYRRHRTPDDSLAWKATLTSEQLERLQLLQITQRRSRARLVALRLFWWFSRLRAAYLRALSRRLVTVLVFLVLMFIVVVVARGDEAATRQETPQAKEGFGDRTTAAAGDPKPHTLPGANPALRPSMGTEPTPTPSMTRSRPAADKTRGPGITPNASDVTRTPRDEAPEPSPSASRAPSAVPLRQPGCAVNVFGFCILGSG